MPCALIQTAATNRQEGLNVTQARRTHGLPSLPALGFRFLLRILLGRGVAPRRCTLHIEHICELLECVCRGGPTDLVDVPLDHGLVVSSGRAWYADITSDVGSL